MIPETQALAERLARHPRFAWAEGMRAHGRVGERVGSYLVEHVDVDRRTRSRGRAQWSVILDAFPDLDDPATGGLLLDALCSSVGCDVRVLTGHQGQNGRVYRLDIGGLLEPDIHRSLGAACADALLRLWTERDERLAEVKP